MATPDPRTDEELVAAANAGDAGAFETLYTRHREWVYRVAHRFAGDPEDALDVLQETFTYFLRKFPGFRLTARLTTFLYPAAKNLALAARRRRGRTASIADAAQAAGSAPADDPGTEQEALREALSTLPDSQREVLVMRYVDDMDLAEIAAALDVPLGTVKSRIHRALETLRADPRTRAHFGL